MASLNQPESMANFTLSTPSCPFVFGPPSKNVHIKSEQGLNEADSDPNDARLRFKQLSRNVCEIESTHNTHTEPLRRTTD